jgi:hypothetical protein
MIQLMLWARCVNSPLRIDALPLRSISGTVLCLPEDGHNGGVFFLMSRISR